MDIALFFVNYENRRGLMVVMAILLYTDQMTRITIWLNQITPDWLKF